MSGADRAFIRKNEDFASPMIAALLIVLFLFFIDEGYYDFRWMREWGNWFVFGIYLLIFFPLQWVLSRFLLRQVKGWKKVIAMICISIPLTLGLLSLV
jgi:hypothetical protein